jgi:hypothetical protein
MTASLTPALALAYLSELSADVRAAIVLGAGGEALAVSGGAGRSNLVAAARDLLAEAPVVRALTDRGGAFGARDELHGIVVATGPLALPGLATHDLLGVLAALGGTPLHAPVSDASPVAAQALLDAL